MPMLLSQPERRILFLTLLLALATLVPAPRAHSFATGLQEKPEARKDEKATKQKTTKKARKEKLSDENGAIRGEPEDATAAKKKGLIGQSKKSSKKPTKKTKESTKPDSTV